ncbi:MAG: ABC transporter permease [Bdellovibrionaceae bacterium]|nr:ABC transporter permease [Pseudobdellovibrionaceae bacterium]
MFNTIGNAVFFIGDCTLFVGEVIRLGIKEKPSLHEIAEQTWRVSMQSLSTTALAGFFVGAIMTVQFTMQIQQFGALGYLGGLSTSGTIREIGPLLIAFMLSGKVGAFTSAELGTMKVTEQLDAIRCLGSSPIREIILPRYIAIILSSFFLLAIGLLMSIGGGLLLGMFFSGINHEEYLRHIPTIVAWPSILIGLFKCLVFSIILASICTYRGYTTTGGAKGVGLAVVNTAVATMIGIVIADWLTSYICEALQSYFLGV